MMTNPNPASANNRRSEWSKQDEEIYQQLPILLSKQLAEEHYNKTKAAIKQLTANTRPRKWKPNMGKPVTYFYKCPWSVFHSPKPAAP
jgi:hypothetical protein